MKYTIHKADSRGNADYGWLKTSYSFSFANYFNPEKVHFGALRVLNDDWIAGGMGFGKHPHDNMEIVTIMLEGELQHGDSMGHTEIIKPDEVQVMSAGTGIYHTEVNNLPDVAIRLFQVWVFPERGNIKPRYDQKYFDPTQRKNQWQVIAGPGGFGPHLEIKQNAWFSRTDLDENTQIEYMLHNPNNGVYVFVIEGNINVNEKLNLSRRDAAGIEDVEKLLFATKSGTQLLLIEVPMM